MNAPHRRGACPGLSAPMSTGDGLLVRFLPTDAIALDAVVALCAAARTHGNGTIEITARGSLQVRGLSARSAPAFASAVGALDIAASEGVSVITDPLADDPEVLVDTASLATKVRAAIADAGLALAAKNSVVIDGGGRLHLDALAADVRLRATGPAQAPRFCVSVGGDAGCAIALGSVLPRDAAEIVVALLGVIAAQGANARAADILRRGGARSFRAVLGDEIESASSLPPRPVAEVIGRHSLRDGTFALGLALAFGHIHVDALAQLVRSDAARGVRGLRLAPDRALLLLGLTHPDAAGLEAEAERLGFIVHADDPRRRLIACAGKPACASGLIAARALAGVIAPHLPASADTVHISGCAKGCAHPRPAALTVVGTERGCGLIEHGDPRAMPQRHVDDADIVAEIVRLAGRAPGSGHSPRPCAEGGGRGSMIERSKPLTPCLSQREREPTSFADGPSAHNALPDYLRDGRAITERSFAIIRAEADLSRFSAEEADVAIRMIHACGLVQAAGEIVFGEGLIGAARAALSRGAPILCDSEMVAHGITRARLPARNEVLCTLRDPRVPALAEKLGTTRSAAALELWGDKLAGAVVAIGNAPTALFHLLDLLDAGARKPAAILGIPVGFVGAAESKEALAANPRGVPFLIVRGRMGGSAMAAAAVNALARAGL